MARSVTNRILDRDRLEPRELERAKEIQLEETLKSLEAAATELLASDPEVITGVWSFTNGLTSGSTITAEGGSSKEWNSMSYFLSG